MTAPAVYSRRSVWLHWLTAVFVLLQWWMGRNMDWFPTGLARMQARSVHMLIGLIVLTLVAERIWRRFKHPAPHAPGGPAIANLAAILVHWALYGLVIGVILAGLSVEWARGDVIFGLFKVAPFDSAHREYRRIAGGVHGVLANILVGVAAFHALAAFVHEAVWRDGVLARMIPPLRKANATAAAE